MRLPTTVNLTILAYLLVSGSAEIIGINPKDADLYKPDADGKWACLNNPEIILDFKQINDDYCDCPDGSDEPGTSACSNGKFFCQNDGYKPSYINAALVNDGVCDYELCCDGSDEWNTPVDCPNKCAEINEEHEKTEKIAKRVRKIGTDKAYKIQRAAKRLRGKLEEVLQSERALLKFNEEELQRFRGAVNEENEADAADLKGIKEGLDEVKTMVGDTFDAFSLNEDNLFQLKNIMDDLYQNFNENLNDNAVKKVIDDYKTHLSEFEEIYEIQAREDTISAAEVKDALLNKLSDDTTAVVDTFSEVFATVTGSNKNNAITLVRVSQLEDILKYLIENYNPNFNDPHVKQAVNAYQDFAVNKQSKDVATDVLEVLDEKLASLAQFIVDTLSKIQKEAAKKVSANLKPIQSGSLYERLRSRFHFMLNDFLGIDQARQSKFAPKIRIPQGNELEGAIAEFESNSKTCVSVISSAEAELNKNFGPSDILRPMEDIRIVKHIGEYDYDLSFIGDIHQRGNNQNVKIGSYDRAEEVQDKEEGLVVYYEHGARCWNGPLRRGVVHIECSDEHELLSVSEPEKCEYHFRMKSPVACKVPEDKHV